MQRLYLFYIILVNTLFGRCIAFTFCIILDSLFLFSQAFINHSNIIICKITIYSCHTAFFLPGRFLTGIATAVGITTACIPLVHALRRSGVVKYTD